MLALMALATSTASSPSLPQQRLEASLPQQRLDASVDGLFAYWWRSNVSANVTGFFFSCGQIGGTPPGGTPWDECKCDNAETCTNCYRWWDAVALEALASRGILFNTSEHAAMARTFLDHSPYNGDFPLNCSYVDDFAWYLLAYIRVFEWLREPRFLAAAESLHDWVLRHGIDQECGGVWWQSGCSGTKNAVTLHQVLIASAKLALLVPQQPLYLRTAEELWQWFASAPLLSPDGLVLDGLMPSADGPYDPSRFNACCNGTHASAHLARCVSNHKPGYSYNQGLHLSAAAHLFAATGEPSYLRSAASLLDALLANHTTDQGLLYEPVRRA